MGVGMRVGMRMGMVRMMGVGVMVMEGMVGGMGMRREVRMEVVGRGGRVMGVGVGVDVGMGVGMTGEMR